MLQLWLIANTVLWPFNIKLGGLSLSLNVPVLIFAGSFWLWKRRRIVRSSARVLLLLFLCLIVFMIVAANSPCNDKLLKSAITAPILLFLSFIGWEIGRRAQASDWLDLRKAAVYSLLAALAGFLVEMAMPSLFQFQEIYRANGKLSGLFQEPSNVAFSLFPCIAVLLVAENKKWRRTGVFALLGLLIMSRSSTLIALMGAWFLYRSLIRGISRRTILSFLGITLLVGLAAAVNYESFLGPTAVRVVGVFGSGDTDNISSLAYLQGWQDAWANLSRTRGLGLGFNMMGCHPLPDVAARELFSLMGVEELNAEDGTFQFAKIVSEAGVVGILFYGVIIWWWIRLEKGIRTLVDGLERSTAATQSALIFCFVASSFIRGGSYFSGGILLWLVAASGASRPHLKPISQIERRGRSSDIGPESGPAKCGTIPV